MANDGNLGQVLFSSPIPNYALAALGLLGILYYGPKLIWGR